jgi:hypothetical protein
MAVAQLRGASLSASDSAQRCWQAFWFCARAATSSRRCLCPVPARPDACAAQANSSPSIQDSSSSAGSDLIAERFCDYANHLVGPHGICNPSAYGDQRNGYSPAFAANVPYTTDVYGLFFGGFLLLRHRPSSYPFSTLPRRHEFSTSCASHLPGTISSKAAKDCLPLKWHTAGLSGEVTLCPVGEPYKILFTQPYSNILRVVLCAIVIGWLGTQSLRSAEVAFRIQGSTVIGGYVNTPVGWRWHMCAGPVYPLPPNSAGRLFRPRPTAPPPSGAYVRCPHGLMLVPLPQVGLRSPKAPVWPVPPPVPNGGFSGREQWVRAELRPSTNQAPILLPVIIQVGGYEEWRAVVDLPLVGIPGDHNSDGHPDNGQHNHMPFKPHPPHPGDPGFPPGPPPGHGPGTGRPLPRPTP